MEIELTNLGADLDKALKQYVKKKVGRLIVEAFNSRESAELNKKASEVAFAFINSDNGKTYGKEVFNNILNKITSDIAKDKDLVIRYVTDKLYSDCYGKISPAMLENIIAKTLSTKHKTMMDALGKLEEEINIKRQELTEICAIADAQVFEMRKTIDLYIRIKKEA